ncbi:hypothetical protein B0T25DRAFT_260060 [Lasiosphaeria hispida]|uniref:Uncharacterized protein n=1 Tax=Lasiosphaeria hispida TaxID=260671 RepID=A0AAJ0MD28_9PEZI|nr:hypothetical protein B0T25DRAFT_260060 [Lasiosphaeria hispida]
MIMSFHNQMQIPSKLSARGIVFTVILLGIRHRFESLPEFCEAWCYDGPDHWPEAIANSGQQYHGAVASEEADFKLNRGIPEFLPGPGEATRFVWINCEGQGIIKLPILISERYPASIIHATLSVALGLRALPYRTRRVYGPRGIFLPIGVQTIALSFNKDCTSQDLEGINCLVHGGSSRELGGFSLIVGKRDYDYLRPLLDQLL